MMKKIIISFFMFCTISCAINVKTINQSKKLDSTIENSELETFANMYFWDNFHAGNYGKIDSILYYLAAAYNTNPNHLETVSHLGFTHMWAISERFKTKNIPPTIVDHSTLALKYFGESHRLNPKDPRILGFLADSKMTIAAISDDKKLSKQAYFEGIKSISQWSEFNYFTIGYVLSGLEQNSWQYKKAVEWQWKTLDKCYCEKFDRVSPDIRKYLPIEKSEKDLKRKRACWNSWIAPHNVEGFYLNMGDMLVKKGDWKKAQEIYLLAKQVPQYENWVFKDVLKKRIENAKENVSKFRKSINQQTENHIDDVMLINSSISCMSCHQFSEKDQEYYKDFIWSEYKVANNVYWLKN